ncbi:hypothetical protein [Roseimaritima ulvae]|uniref:hypothetical protein n=1 Tax=Roseimaritima ulvae TaxID=980254 RepID=UPI0011CE1C6A|nr:hypothetical protein [Roseimaritima ulvae]
MLTIVPVVGRADAPLRTLNGRYAEIVTDLPSTPATDALPAAIDAAVPQWIRFWRRPAACVDGWKMTVYLMGDKSDFERRGLIPATLPDFPHGFQMGDQAWAVAQRSDYFTRHLVLHETFHGFAAHVFGGVGPNWFAEGTAEMMATHKGSGAAIRVPSIPADRQSVPFWGRFKLISQRRDEQRMPTLETVLRRRDLFYRNVEPYAWSWSAVVMMTMYPEYLQALIEASQRAPDRSYSFTREFQEKLAVPGPAMQARWQLLLSEFDYGYDTRRNRVDWPADPPEWDRQPGRVRIAAQRGWQLAGVWVTAGTKLRLTASGRYSLGETPRRWVCEPQGVTVRYHRGRPLGMVLAALVPRDVSGSETLPGVQIEAIGRQATITAKRDSWLLLRIGDDPAALADNSGVTTVNFQIRE